MDYNHLVNIKGLHKLKREDLIEELEKHLTISYNKKGEHKVTLKHKKEYFDTKKQSGEKEAKMTYKKYKIAQEIRNK